MPNLLPLIDCGVPAVTGFKPNRGGSYCIPVTADSAPQVLDGSEAFLGLEGIVWEESALVAAVGLGAGVLLFGVRRLWRFTRGLI